MELVCKNCPVGCHLTIVDNVVTGNRCPRGLSYKNAEEESVFFTTVKIDSKRLGHLSIKSNRPITEEEKTKVRKLLEDYELKPPINANEVVIKNIGDLDIDFISQRKINV